MCKDQSIIAILFLFILSCSALCAEKQVPPPKWNQKEKILTAKFLNVDDAISVLKDKNSELQWEASDYLKKHPATAISKLQELIEKKHPSWFIAMCTLTDISGKSVVRFYCDLLDKNHYTMDSNGKRKFYGYGSHQGCMNPHNFFGKVIVKQIGRLGDKTADACLQRAWLDSDREVQASVPKARYDIGILTLNKLIKLIESDKMHRGIYCNTLLSIAQDQSHKKTNSAIEIYEMICALTKADNSTRSNAHISLIHCYELKKNYTRALAHCDWIIKNSEEDQFVSRYKVRRPILLFYQGQLTLDDLFDLAVKQNKLYDLIAQLGRSCKYNAVRIFDRIIKEAPPNSKYVMEAHYWKLEYFDYFNMPKRAKLQSQYILQNCKYNYILKWIRRRLVKKKQIAKQNDSMETRSTVK